MNDTQVILRRRKGWQTRTTHSHLGSTTQSYSRKEGLVELVKVNIPAEAHSPGASFVTLAKEEFRRARRDGRVKKTAEVGKVTVLAFTMGASASQAAPRPAMTITGGPSCPDCHGPVERRGNGLTSCRADCSPKTGADHVREGLAERTEQEVEAALSELGDRMESCRKGLEELTRLLLKG